MRKFKPYLLRYLLYTLLFLAGIGCVPIAELPKMQEDRGKIEKRMDLVETKLKERSGEASLSTLREVEQLQKNQATLEIKMDRLITDLQIIQGKIEENNHRLSELGKRLDELEYEVSALSPKTEPSAKPSTSEDSGSKGVPLPEGTRVQKLPGRVVGSGPTEIYNRAYNDYVQGNYDLAVSGFQNYLSQFPKSNLAPDAKYWMGECYYSKADYPKAIEAFDRFVTEHPQSDKSSSGLLKIGFSYIEIKNKETARLYLKKVVEQYPNSKEAVLAKNKLSSLK